MKSTQAGCLLQKTIEGIAKRACQRFEQRTDDYNVRLFEIIVDAIREAEQRRRAERVAGRLGETNANRKSERREDCPRGSRDE